MKVLLIYDLKDFCSILSSELYKQVETNYETIYNYFSTLTCDDLGYIKKSTQGYFEKSDVSNLLNKILNELIFNHSYSVVYIKQSLKKTS